MLQTTCFELYFSGKFSPLPEFEHRTSSVPSQYATNCAILAWIIIILFDFRSKFDRSPLQPRQTSVGYGRCTASKEFSPISEKIFWSNFQNSIRDFWILPRTNERCVNRTSIARVIWWKSWNVKNCLSSFCYIDMWSWCCSLSLVETLRQRRLLRHRRIVIGFTCWSVLTR